MYFNSRTSNQNLFARVLCLVMTIVMAAALMGGCTPADSGSSAEHTQITEPTIMVSSATAKPGDTVEITLTISNNPGLIGITLPVMYDESVMTLTSITKGDALSEMTFTKPKNLSSGLNLPWDAEEVLPEDATNGIMVKLIFQILDTAEAGEYAISLGKGDIVDNDLNPVAMQLINGKITVSK